MRKGLGTVLALTIALSLTAAGCGRTGGTVSTQETSASENVGSTQTEPMGALEKTETETGAESNEALLREDFYEYINQDIIKKAKIPEGFSEWNQFYELNQSNQAVMEEILDQAVEERETREKGSIQQQIADFYLTAADMEGRKEAGLGGLQVYLDKLKNAETVEEYLDVNGQISQAAGVSSILLFYYAIDPNDAGHYMPALYAPDCGLGKENLEDPEQEESVRLYRDYIEKTLELAGYENTGKTADEILAFQKRLAASSLSLSEVSNPEITNNQYSREKFKNLFSNIDTDRLLKAYHMDDWDQVIITQEESAAMVNECLTEENLPLLKVYSAFCLLNDMGKYLTPEIRDNKLAFENALNGIQGQKTDDKMAREMAMEELGFEFGRLFVEKTFSQESKRDIENMVAKIKETYKKRIMELAWMEEETKEKAIEKLDRMGLKIGYPDKWPDTYDGVEILSPEEGGSLIDNHLALMTAQQKKMQEDARKPVDKEEWLMTPQTVNAYYNPSGNEIVFPAGILQPPYYDPEAEEGKNLGGIGFVIGHEITHAFDSSGAQYDAEGNVNNWWTEGDLERFKELTKSVVDYYDEQTVLDGRHVNGSQTLGENIADLGSMACMTEIIGDDTESLKVFFTNNANIWASKMTEEALLQRLNTDVHAPRKIRVNAVVSVTDAFYKAYPEIQEGDKMYVAPEKRVKVW